jgi:multiple sugar transport system permease protein
MKQRPTGISIISIGLLVVALFAIVGAYRSLPHLGNAFGFLLWACIMGSIGFGLWTLRNWARTGLIVWFVLAFVAEILRRLSSGRLALSEEVFEIAVFALFLWYLRRPGVREAFSGDDGWGKVAHWTVLTVFVVLLAFPFYWMVIATFKQNIDLYNVENNPFIFNLKPTLANLRLLFLETSYVRWLGNTALVGTLVVAITLLLSIPAAYALARLTGRWGERLGIGIFLTYLVPPTLLFIPLSRVVATLGLQDTIWSLVLVYPSVTIPFSIWLLMGFFKSIPRELEDAAMVDGLTRFGAFVKMVVPISLSGILTVVIFTFTLVTQEFVYALTFISPESQQMVGVGIPIFLVRGDVYFWGSLMAACLIASLPIAFLYNLFLDRFIAGFTVGAVKG